MKTNLTATETKLISINAALAERAARLGYTEARLATGAGCGCMHVHCSQCRDIGSRAALRAQVRDLEAEKHALLQKLPV